MKITSLKLNNFRQFRKKKIDFEGDRTVIVAPNAAGKSSIIEALYMLSHGDSPWELQNGNIVRRSTKAGQNKSTKEIARIEATVETDDELKTAALILSSNGSSTTKQFQVEGSSTNRSKFVNTLSCLLFSPDLIDILMYEPSQRRRFLDHHTSRIHPEISEISLRYMNVLRQRNSLLKMLANGSGNSSRTNSKLGLEYWTEQLISLGSEILLLRHTFLNILNEPSSSYPATIEYIPTVPLHELEDLGTGESIQEIFKQKLEETQKKELKVGVTLVGPHRDDWHLKVNNQDLNTFGSRGEKRIAIADVIFKISNILNKEQGQLPTLLLDDITSELDKENIERLFSEKIAPEQQTIITTTDLDSLPTDISDNSQIITLK